MKKMTKINIFIENIHETITIDEKKVIEDAKKMLKYFLNKKDIFNFSCLLDQKFNCISFDILFCNSEKTHEINKEYRQKDYAADIITFSIFADGEEKFIFDEEINLGEFIISLDKVKENSMEKQCSFDEELLFLIAHGIMHLLGFDHQTDEDYNFIVKVQNEALDYVKSL